MTPLAVWLSSESSERIPNCSLMPTSLDFESFRSNCYEIDWSVDCQNLIDSFYGLEVIEN